MLALGCASLDFHVSDGLSLSCNAPHGQFSTFRACKSGFSPCHSVTHPLEQPTTECSHERETRGKVPYKLIREGVFVMRVANKYKVILKGDDCALHLKVSFACLSRKNTLLSMFIISA